MKELREGYRNFTGSSSNSLEDAFKQLDGEINQALEGYDMTFIGGASIKFDDNTSYRPMPMYLVAQTTVLKKKNEEA